MNPAQLRSFVTRLKTSRGPSFDLLVQLDQHRVLTTGQVARLMGAPARTTSYRLDRLQQAKMVDCARPGREAGSAPRHWWLTLAGARMVAGVAPAEGRRPSAFFAAHTSAIAEVWLSVLERGPAAGITPTRWYSDRAGWSVLPTAGSARQQSVTPDGLLLADLSVPDDSAPWPTAALFEVDLNTETQKGLGDKLARYLQYAADRVWASDGLPHCPPLLLLTTSEARATTWLRTAAKATARYRRRRGLDYRFAGRGAARRDVEAAERLVIAACGLVHTPATAVTEPVWQVVEGSDSGGVGAEPVTLAQLLTERVATGRVADDWYDRLTAEADAAARVSTLWDVGRDARLGELLGDARAGEVLPRLIGNAPSEFAAAHPRLAEQVLGWWPHRHDGQALTMLAEIRTVLVDEHARIWDGQARQVLAAGRHPKVAAAAAVLQDGRLLPGLTVELLAGGAEPGHVAAHQARRGRYAAAREQAVTARWQGLPWRVRRRTDRDELAAAYDDTELLVCELCAGITTRRPVTDPAVTEPWDYGGNDVTEPGDACPHCGAGRLLEHTDRHQVPTLDARLDELRTRLAAGG